MLADITSVSRDIDSFARSRVVRLSISNPDRTSSAGSKDVFINRLLTNVINIRREHYVQLPLRPHRKPKVQY